MKSSITSAALAGLSLVACAFAYATRGAVPDILAVLATTSMGGFLGISVPFKQ